MVKLDSRTKGPHRAVAALTPTGSLNACVHEGVGSLGFQSGPCALRLSVVEIVPRQFLFCPFIAVQNSPNFHGVKRRSR
jgi:hypothetical protein